MNNKKSAGFGVVEILLLVVVVSIIGFVGYRVYESNLSVQDAQNIVNTPIAGVGSEGTSVPAVNSAADIDKVNAMLDNADIEGGTEQELSSELAY